MKKNATPRARFSFAVHDISRMRRTLFDQALKPLGITRAQWWVLGNLSRQSDAGMTQTELARFLDIGKVTVGGLLDRLEDSGLVRREDDAGDRRVKRVFITSTGFETLGKIKSVGGRLDRVVFRNVAEAEIASACAVLAQVKTNLSDALKGEVLRPEAAAGVRASRARR
jgi:DNA-binding MarR family transcriptional regulator